jgi:hypothetical protein
MWAMSSFFFLCRGFYPAWFIIHCVAVLTVKKRRSFFYRKERYEEKAKVAVFSFQVDF